MRNEFQDLDWTRPIVKRMLQRNARTKVSTIFRFLRNHRRLTLFGDYPLMTVAVDVVRQVRGQVAREEIVRAMIVSKELSGKRYLLDRLLED